MCISVLRGGITLLVGLLVHHFTAVFKQVNNLIVKDSDSVMLHSWLLVYRALSSTPNRTWLSDLRSSLNRPQLNKCPNCLILGQQQHIQFPIHVQNSIQVTNSRNPGILKANYDVNLYLFQAPLLRGTQSHMVLNLWIHLQWQSVNPQIL
jgi:hypothetical protein